MTYLIFPSEGIVVSKISDCFGSRSSEQTGGMKPVRHFTVKHWWLDHHGQAKACLKWSKLFQYYYIMNLNIILINNKLVWEHWIIILFEVSNLNWSAKVGSFLRPKILMFEKSPDLQSSTPKNTQTENFNSEALLYSNKMFTCAMGSLHALHEDLPDLAYSARYGRSSCSSLIFLLQFDNELAILLNKI